MRRKITLLLIIALSTMGAFAHSGRGASKLNLQLFDDGNFTVVLDGIRYPNVNANFQVPNLYAGTHRIKIVENFYSRRGHRNGREVLYSGPINIPYNSRVVVQLTQNNRLRTVRVDRNRHNHRNGRNSYHRKGQGNRGQAIFNQAKRDIRQARFERDKLAIARQTVRQQNLSAFQVAELMNMMAFESSRLRLAKFAYRFHRRGNNYVNVVSRSFEFASSRRELIRFIRNY